MKIFAIRLILLLSVGWVSLDARAQLPFFGSKFPFELRLEPENEDLKKHFEKQLKQHRSESLAFEAYNLHRRAARFDRNILEQLVKSEGYYQAEVASQIETGEDEDDKTLVHTITLGEQFHIAEIRWDFPAVIALPPDDTYELAEGDPMVAQAVIDARKAITQYVQDNYCLYRVDVSYEARIQPERKQGFIEFKLKPSPSVRFGDIELTGLESIEPDYMRYYLEFESGDCFKRPKIDLTRLNLLQSNLLSTADAVVAEPSEGEVDITFELQERRHRTVKAGLGYDGDFGPALLTGWEHRNLFDRGQRLEIETELGELRKSLDSQLTIPHFWKRDQVLTLEANLSDEKLEAYDATKGEFAATLSRKLNRYWRASAGTAVEFSRIEEAFGQSEDYALLSFPLSATYSDTNNIINPTKGATITVSTRPFIDLYDTSTRFFKTSVVTNFYATESDWLLEPTLALRLATGTITGESLRAVPADHRYYSGGGGSIRGYEYQSVGEFNVVDVDGDGEISDSEFAPAGGQSFSEASLELRLRLAESWGFVLFTDGGYAYPGETPSFGEDFLWGAGVGLRYYTSFAPIRFDVATPLNKRYRCGDTLCDHNDAGAEAIDQDVELYISIGQAF